MKKLVKLIEASLYDGYILIEILSIMPYNKSNRLLFGLFIVWGNNPFSNYRLYINLLFLPTIKLFPVKKRSSGNGNK